MNNKRILVTGSAGFIGFHLTSNLLKDGFTVLGVDNMNDYYTVSLKRSRLNILKEYKGFLLLNFINIQLTVIDTYGNKI